MQAGLHEWDIGELRGVAGDARWAAECWLHVAMAEPWQNGVDPV